MDFTLRLDGTDWSKSYSLLNAANRTFENRPNLPVEVGDVFVELYSLKSDYPPMTAGETVTVRLIHPPLPPPAPANLMASPAGPGEVALSWDAPAADSGVTRHEYRFKTTGDYGGWTAIPASARGETNALGYTVARLGYQVDSVDFLFQVRAMSARARAPRRSRTR